MTGQQPSLIARLIPKVVGILALLLGAWWIATDSVHPVHAIAWAIVMAIASFRAETEFWPEGSQKMKLPPEWQLALVFGLFLTTAVTSPFLPWRRAFHQWGMFIFAALPLYREGLAWAWKRLTREE
jgi:hypothetical protein